MNCLLTKLKSVIDNDALPKLGVFRFTLVVGSTPSRANVFHAVEANKSLFTIVSGPSGGTIKAVRTSPSEDVDKGTSFFLDTSLDSYTFSAPGTYVIEITEKYNIKTFRTKESTICNTEDFLSLDNLQGKLTLTGSGVKGKLSDLVKPAITQYDLSGLDVTGSIGVFADGTTSVVCSSMPDITGNISVFSSNQALSVLALNGCYKIEGEVSQINNIPNLTNFQCSGNAKITGSLGELLDNGALINSHLNTLVVTNTIHITKNTSDVNTLRSLGVDVVL